ncbi:hypothetical protein ACTMTI_27480 [Nonomuraea sp. H19]|uniref:hypothetical protein n=1 Tax=Nonomuraea sp. H19 TaxID=3452206 RepID=UPI003F8C64CC
MGANRELINGIGVAPDHYLPLTAKDLREGRDPAMAAAAARPIGWRISEDRG